MISAEAYIFSQKTIGERKAIYLKRARETLEKIKTKMETDEAISAYDIAWLVQQVELILLDKVTI